jgi:hypothetical protein
MTANRRRSRNDVERTSKLTRAIAKILRVADVFRSRNLAQAMWSVEGIGKITTCPLFHGGHAEALLPCPRLQQTIILQLRAAIRPISID